MQAVSVASKLVALAMLAMLAMLGACAAPKRAVPPAASEVRIERTDREFALDPAITRVAIDNPWGEINIRARDEREVGLHAVIQRQAPRYANAQFRSRREGDTLHIDVRFDGNSEPDAAASSGRIDIAVFLPTDLALALSTRDGRISAKKRAGAIEATSQSGEIQASSRDRLLLRTQSGQIRAIAIGARWPGASEIATDSGRIVLLVPTFGDVALAATTGGPLRSGFGLSVHPLAGGGHEAHARYGAATSSLHARSVSGEIVLEQLVLLGDDARLPEDDD